MSFKSRTQQGRHVNSHPPDGADLCQLDNLVSFLYSVALFLQIVLPTGTRVKIYRGWSDFINVEIIPSVLDWQQTEGLCGFYDGSAANDQINRDQAPDTGGCTRSWKSVGVFSSSWK